MKEQAKDLGITKGEFTFTPQTKNVYKDKKLIGCFEAQVWDKDGNNFVALRGTHSAIEATANANLICEAFNVANQTSKSPKMLLEENKSLKQSNKELVDSLEKAEKYINKMEGIFKQIDQ